MFQNLFSRAPAGFEQISGDDAIAMHKANEAIFVDVRGADEIAKSGTVKGAIRAPLPGFSNFAKPDGTGSLPAVGSDKAIVVLCASGGRSSNACQQLAAMGYERLYNLRGGFGAFAAANGPTER